MRARNGVDSSVRCDFENGMAVFVHDENIATLIRHGEVWTRKGSIGRVAAFESGKPIIYPIHSPGPIAGDRVQHPKGFEQIGVACWAVCGYVHCQQPKEVIAAGEREETLAGRIGREIVLLHTPWYCRRIRQRRGNFNTAYAVREGIGPTDI